MRVIKPLLLLLFLTMGIFVFAREVLIFADHSDGMEGFVRIDPEEQENNLYHTFFNNLRNRLSDVELGYTTFTLFDLEANRPRKQPFVDDLGKSPGFYNGRATNLVKVLARIPREMRRRKAGLALLITDNVLSLPAGRSQRVNARAGFDLPLFRSQLTDFITEIGGLGIIGVRSGFKGMYYAEVPRHNQAVRFPVPKGDKNYTGIDIRPFFIYAILGKEKKENTAKVLDNLYRYLVQQAGKKKITGEVVQRVLLMPAGDAGVSLGTASLPKKFFSKKNGGAFFAIQVKDGNRINFSKEDPIPIHASGTIMDIPFKARQVGFFEWIIPNIKFEPFAAARGGKTIADAGSYIRFQETDNELQLYLFRLSRDLGDGDIEIKCNYSINYAIPRENEQKWWWDRWSTGNDRDNPHKTIYFNRWLRTVMQIVLEREQASASQESLVLHFKGNGAPVKAANRGSLIGVFFFIALGLFLLALALVVIKHKRGIK